jgi:hypothetical protein
VPPYFKEYRENLRQFMQLLKALYGTKQAALLWHILIKQVLKDLGYIAEVADTCAFNYFDSTGALIAKSVLHVDDLPMVAKDPSEFKRVADYLQQQAHLEITESASWNKILGVHFGYDLRNNMVIYNDVFISSLLTSLQLTDIPEYDLPHAPNVYYVPNEGTIASQALHSKFRTIIGSLLWMTIQWRMDIDFIVNHLSRFLANPSLEHYNASLRVLGYLKRTLRDGMTFTRPLTPLDSAIYPPQILIHSDANWSGDKDCKSISSIIVSIHTLPEITKGLNDANFPTTNAISWSSKRQQSFVADSSEAAETYCMVEASKSNSWLRDKFTESAAEQLNPTILLNDNKAAILNASEGRLTAKNRHKARKISILRNELELGNVTYLHIPTHRNHANNGTKPANKSDFFRDKWAYMSTAVDFNDRNDSEDTNIMESKPDEDS